MTFNSHSQNAASDSSLFSEQAMKSTVSLDSQYKILRIAVGSSNPSKKRAVEQAFRIAVRDRPILLDIQGFQVESGVSDQPYGDDETKTGAQNRAKAAYHAYRQANNLTWPHIAVGMEGGLEWSGSNNNSSSKLYCMAWMALYGKREATSVDAFAGNNIESYVGDKKPICSFAKTALFVLPDGVTKLVKQNVELGDATDIVFEKTRSKHGTGTVGILTDGLIDRSGYYDHAILLALVPWIRPDLYDGDSFDAACTEGQSEELD
jgi:non-canonical (house-cleaning) NTP pyrophosphatase